MYNSRTKSTLLPRSAARRLSPWRERGKYKHLIGELFRRTANIRTTIRPHHPSVVQKIKNIPSLISLCLQYMISIFAPFRSRSCVRSSRWPLILHSTFIPIIHFSTPRLREILISISQAPFIPFSPSPFPTHFQWYVFHFCGELAPVIA